LNEIPIGLLLLGICLLLAVLLLVVSAESSLLHVARSRLRQLAATGNRSAQLADDLLRLPERIRGAARILETIAIVGISACATLLWARSAQLIAVMVGVVSIAALLLLCTQWLPRHTRSDRSWWLAVAAHLFAALIAVFGPLIDFITQRTARPAETKGAARNRVPTRTNTAAEDDHRALHERVADLDNIAVDDIMIPRSDLAILDVADDWEDLLATLRSTPHTRLPLCENGIDNIIGIVHMKKVAHALARSELTCERLIEIARAREPYFTPEGTTLSDQLVNFKRDRRRVALVVDEYGDIQGLVTLEDILEEIVGEFTTSPTMLTREVHRESEDSYIVSGSASVRDLNRMLGWKLPVDGPRTLNGLIVEQLETIPQAGTAFRIGELAIEILQTAENAVRSARIKPTEEHEAPELSKGMA
jgi:Mg2+/Co2+ transporter CorB